MSEKPSSYEAGTFFVASIIAGQGAWSIGHNIGKNGEISTEQLIVIWVASVSALLATFVIGRTSDGEQYVSISGTALLSIPTIWFLCEIFFYQYEDGVIGWLRFFLTLGSLVVALPYVLYLLLVSAVPDIAEIRHKRLWIGLVGIVSLIAVVGYTVGHYK